MGDAASLKTVTSMSVSAAPSQGALEETVSPGWQRHAAHHVHGAAGSPGGARLTGEFMRRQFTPPAEERENPMESVGARLKGDGQEDS